MGTATTGQLTDAEKAQTNKAIQDMGQTGASLPAPARPFVFAAFFDGTNNNKDDVKLSDSPFQTNVANLADQAEAARATNKNLAVGYYPGVGTGGEMGGLPQAAFSPTDAVMHAAEAALAQFARAAHTYLQDNPTATAADLSASAVGFSRGGPTAVVFAQLLNERGLKLPDGTVVAPPGVPVYGLVPIDPVATGIDRNLSIPPNVKGDVLMPSAALENRQYFELADYSGDGRVVRVDVPNNHSGIGGGYDKQGTGAAVLEGVTAYLQKSGVPLAEVKPEYRFDASQPVRTYSEAIQTARNGDILTDDKGKPLQSWPTHAGDTRATKPVTPVADTLDPRDPASSQAVNGLDFQSDQATAQAPAATAAPVRSGELPPQLRQTLDALSPQSPAGTRVPSQLDLLIDQIGQDQAPLPAPTYPGIQLAAADTGTVSDAGPGYSLFGSKGSVNTDNVFVQQGGKTLLLFAKDAADKAVIVRRPKPEYAACGI